MRAVWARTVRRRLRTQKSPSSATLPSTIAGGTSAKLVWLIIPAPSAGGADPNGALYFVGAHVNYSIVGADTSVDVAPDYRCRSGARQQRTDWPRSLIPETVGPPLPALFLKKRFYQGSGRRMFLSSG